MLILGVEIPAWLILTINAVIALYFYGTWTFNTFKNLGIPYRTPLIPFLGNLSQLFSKSLPVHDVEQKTLFPGKISGFFQGRQPWLEVADAEFAHQILTTEFSKFRNRRLLLAAERLGSSMFMAEGDHWRHVRNTLTPTFSSGKLKQMYGAIKDCADKLVAHLRKKAPSPVYIKEYTGGYTADVIAITAFGLDVDVQSTTNHPFVVHAGAMIGIPKTKGLRAKIKDIIIGVLVLFAIPIQIKKWMYNLFGFSILDEESYEYFVKIIEDVLTDRQADRQTGRQADRQTDVCSGSQTEKLRNKNFITMVADKLIDLKEVDKSTIRISGSQETKWSTAGLTKEEVYANAVLFIAAGYETTAASLQYFFYNMALNPHIQEKLYEAITEVSAEGDFTYEQLHNLDYLEWCVKESLRLLPAATRIDRDCSEDVVVNGMLIPQGMSVQILVYAMHHDSDYWEEPEAFNPDRFAPENISEIQQFAYLPFGGGSRMCIASRLALLELKVGVVKMMSQFRFEKTANTPEPAELKFKKVINLLQMESPLEICAVPRKTE